MSSASVRTTEGTESERKPDGALMGSGEQVQVSDQALLDLMRSEESFGVSELAERLGVTDTAVRQRLTRLLDRGFVQRVAVREGRGRPKHLYRLTEAGLRESGANLEDLAVALWQEVVELEDAGLRERLIARVVDRLAQRYLVEITGSDPMQRMKSVVDLFNRRGIPFSLEEKVGGQTRLKILGCPYPGLRGSDRYVCLMEQMLFQRLIGSEIESISCEVSQSGCCEYVPLTGSPEAEKTTTNPSGCHSGSGCHCQNEKHS